MGFTEEKNLLDGISPLLQEHEEVEWPSLDAIEQLLQYEFKDKKLLNQAFTHHSFYYPEKVNGDNLSVLGDSVLNIIVTTKLFHLYPKSDRGQLTNLRSANVNNHRLARLAVKHRFDQFIRRKNDELDDQIRLFKEEILTYPTQAIGMIKVPKFLADTMESLMGAVYIDSNFSVKTSWEVFKKLLEPLRTPDSLEVHPKTQLVEFCQKNGLPLRMEQNKEIGMVKVYVNGILMVTRVDPIRSDINENRAAKDTLELLLLQMKYASICN